MPRDSAHAISLACCLVPVLALPCSALPVAATPLPAQLSAQLSAHAGAMLHKAPAVNPKPLMELPAGSVLTLAQDDTPPAFDPEKPPAGTAERNEVQVGPRDVDAETDEAPEQEVRIIRRGDDEITEYREGGRLRVVKVTPAKGPVYYLIDADGDGNLETRADDLDGNFAIPAWVILRW